MDGSTKLRASILEFLEGWPLFDNAIIRHGFTPYMRDFEVLVDAAAPMPGEARSYTEGRYRYLFTHCVVAHVMTAVSDEAWTASWDDVLTKYPAWEGAGHPTGYVWGVEYMVAYPGARYVTDSLLANEWARRLGHAMHEIVIETNAHNLQLVCHDVRVYKVGEGDPATGEVAPVDPIDLSTPAT